MSKLLNIDAAIIVFFMLIFIPPVASGFVLSKYVSGRIVEEKTNKLYGIANTLDKLLTSDYDTILEKYNMQNASKEDKIKVLSKELSPVSDTVVSGFKDTGIGYYSKELDAIITYSPSEKMNWTIGMPISKNHNGREAMATKQWISYRGGELVWGNGIAVFFPIIRNNESIGYIWAVELDENINKELFPMYVNIAIAVSILIGIGIAVFSILLFKYNDKKYIRSLNDYIKCISSDNSIRLPQMQGIYGEINNTINLLSNQFIEQKEIETRMLKAENMLVGSFITLSIAHEIKNPLMSIKGFSDLIKESSSDNSIIKYTKIISDETERINKLIGNLLSVSKKNDVINEKHCINNLINESVSLLLPNFRRHNVSYTIKSSQDYYIICDSNRFKQIILNMLLNSLSAFDGRDNNKIEITLSDTAESGMLSVSIKDNGCGIPDYIMQDIFQPFWTTKSNSTGLGLFIVKSFIDSMGWQLHVSSLKDLWTCFTITMPYIKEY
ncbi:ATP-binding protein [Mucispirillum schaedleri]|uniref:ATP-binding protein n=1 Tax=Mucispirillum schaedleri TaxID=248039 RepID=UPI001F593927|nr:ATP-binding protein [Mucispirillum schaedleri]